MTRKRWFLVSLAIVVVLLTAVMGGLQLAGPAGAQGGSAPSAAASGGGDSLGVTVAVSKPANGSFFVAGEKPVVTVTLKDKSGAALSQADMATLGLYAYGPQETTKTVTAAKLLNATTDRTKTPHHYIDLLTNTNVQVSGNVLTYTLQPVSTEEPGTYTATVRAVKKGDPPLQNFALADFQVGTATAEKQIVEKENCAACHQGAQNGQFYFAHVDVGRSPYGSPSLESWPVRTCKSCHNNDGYAAYGGNIADPTGPSTVRTPDSIVRRVHGVHMGEELTNTFNTDPKTGNFKAYTGVIFPANVKNCTACHVDNRWKTQPSRQACGACHDGTWFGETVAMPKTFKAHAGGPQANDANCAVCHPADTGGLKAVAEAHKVSQPYDQVALSLTPPANGKFYVAGEKPVVTIVVKDAKGNPIDHTKVDNTNFSTASLFVYGPRAQSKPVLTSTAANGNSKARASASSSIAASGTPKAWTFAKGDTFKIAANGGAVQELAAPEGLQTPDQVAAWLKANLKDVTVTANNTAGSINIRSNVQGAKSKFEIYDSAVTTKMGWKPGPLNITEHGQVVGKTAGTTVEPFVVIGAMSTASNDLRKLSDPLDYADPRPVRSTGNITYQLDDVAGLQPGTYMVYMYTLPVAGKFTDVNKTAFGFITFQVGTATEEKKVATNCTNCHGNNIWHLDEGPIHAEPFDTDYCKACHDYGRYATGNGFSRLGGDSLSGWSGYGAVPLSRRLHGVHFGRYLDFPEGIYAGNPNIFSEVIFPQDVRNCTKCHSADTSGTWKQASRLACTGCHDKDIANAHAQTLTLNRAPDDPWSVDNLESCGVCHGIGKEFSVEKMHNISDPYKPPYRREPE